MIYFIQAGDHGPVKIGYAEDVPKRFRELQCGNHLKLRLLRTLEGGRAAEAWFHREFTFYKIRAEWFVFAGAMLTAGPPAPVVVEPLAVWPVIEKLAPQAGITAEALRKAKERKRVPYRWHALLMALAQQEGVTLQLKDLAA